MNIKYTNSVSHNPTYFQICNTACGSTQWSILVFIY